MSEIGTSLVSGFFPDLFDYENLFQKPMDDSIRLQQWRNLCYALENRDTNLPQIRLQLQLQIDELQSQLNVVQSLIQIEQQLIVKNTRKQSIKLTDL